jgi:type II secretory pathway component GspD/PulD (secretin)
MDGESWRRKAGPLVLAACGTFTSLGVSQTTPPRPPDLPITRLEGAGAGAESSGILSQPAVQRPGELPSLPITQLDERPRTADLDGPRRISLTVSRPMALRDVLALLFSATPLRVVFEEGVDGTFTGALTDLTMREALEAVLFPRGLDYDVQGTLIRVFPRKAATRLFDVNYLNFRRTWQRTVRSAISVSSPQAPAAEISTSIGSDLFDDLGKGVQSLLSESGRMHVDRSAGLVQVTDFADRLDQVGVYLEAVQLRATRQVRIDARIFQVTLRDPAATSIDWRAVASRLGASVRTAAGRAVGMRIDDFDAVKTAIAEQGTVTMIAAPRVVAMNNEPAVMRAGTQGVYFTAASQIDQAGRPERTFTPVSILEGLTLTVTAQIAADGIVHLSVAPTYAEKTGQSKSAAGDILPVLQVSEADTLVRVQDGDTVVISGFLQDRLQGKPGTGLAGFFGAQARETVKSELVILLTPVVVTAGNGSAAGGR